MKEEHGTNYRSFGGAVVISGTVSNAHFINCSYEKNRTKEKNWSGTVCLGIKYDQISKIIVFNNLYIIQGK